MHILYDNEKLSSKLTLRHFVPFEMFVVVAVGELVERQYVHYTLL
jgi:hypothetical protein